MREEGIQAKIRWQFKVTTRVDPDAPVAPNLLHQYFETPAPNRVWVEVYFHRYATRAEARASIFDYIISLTLSHSDWAIQNPEFAGATGAFIPGMKADMSIHLCTIRKFLEAQKLI